MERTTLVLLSLGLSLPVMAEAAAAPEAPQASLARRSFGVGAGATSGCGLSWRETWDNGYGYSIGGGAWVPTFDPPRGIWSLGLQGHRIIAESGGVRFYGLAGLQTYGYPVTSWSQPTVDPQTTSPENYPAPVPSTSYDSVLNVGAGIGFEMGFQPGLSLVLELPLVLGFRTGQNAGLSHLIPIPNALIVYNF